MAYRHRGFAFNYSLTPWVKRLLIANAAVFLLTWVLPVVARVLAFVPSATLFQPWTLVTYMFVHGGFWHLFINMLILFFFGPPLEDLWGSREFIKFYFVAGLGGAAFSFLFAFDAAVIGASAAIYGVMLAFAMNWPNMPIYIWGILPVPAKYLVGFMGVIAFMSAIGGGGDGVAHFAHLGGLVAAFVYLKVDYRLTDRIERLRKVVVRQKFQVTTGGQPKDETPPGRRVDDQMLDEVDRVLEKISQSGLGSLSERELQLLDEVSKRYRQN